jgi:hypothetical protein
MTNNNVKKRVLGGQSCTEEGPWEKKALDSILLLT